MQCQFMYKPESTERGGGGGGTGDKGPGGAIVPVNFGQLASVDGLRWSCRAARWPFWREFGGRSVGRMAGQWQTGCGQAGNGRARNRGRASLNSASQDQRCGRCKVRRRAERVSRPAMEKKRRRRVLGGHYLFAETEPRRPASEVMRHHLDGQPAGSAFLGHPGESPRGRIHIMTPVRTTAGINRVHPHRVSAQTVSRARVRRRSG